MLTRPEFLIAATKSGSGKTLLTLGILAALKKRQIKVQPFKCGPDFIDPSLHKLAADATSYNLDLRMMGEEGCQNSFSRYGAGAEAIVVEGVMGLFDGGIASSASLAKTLDIPVVLVVDVRSAAESVAAVIKGFESFDPDLKINGVICNRVGSERHTAMIRDAVEANCHSKILGFFPREEAFQIPSRHLGLHMGHEHDSYSLELDKLVQHIETHIDLDLMLEQSEKSRIPHVQQPSVKKPDSRVRIGVASDEAFCFYYPENFDILREAGAELVFFSPLSDSSIPKGLNALYFGGGYPELFADQLADNASMRESVREWATEKKPVYGECGGFMYLCEEIQIGSGEVFPMAGIFPVKTRMKPRLSSLGYREATTLNESWLADTDQVLYGHEFHYSEVVERDHDLPHFYTLNSGKKEGCMTDKAIGSYVHLHFSRSQSVVKRILGKI